MKLSCFTSLRRFGLSPSISRKSATLCFAAVPMLVMTAQADPINLVQNGGFEQISLNQSSVIGPTYSNQLVANWSNPGNSGAPFAGSNNYVALPNTADTTGFAGAFLNNPKFWGPGTGVNNGFEAVSPAGGNFVALDGGYTAGASPLTQTINGLVAGTSYTLSYYIAEGQLTDGRGEFTSQLQVSLGGETKLSPAVQVADQGFVPWRLENLTFTATSSSEVLSFLASGTPEGTPPMVLLDGVSLVATPPAPVPEPSSWALMLTSAAGLAGVLRLRRK